MAPHALGRVAAFGCYTLTFRCLLPQPPPPTPSAREREDFLDVALILDL